ncbi:hypothetical protein ACFLZW_02500 [Chloroflexota bacterium]
MERLASAILIQTVKDWNDESKRPEIRSFMTSTWFVTVVEMAGLDPGSIRAKLESGSFANISLRAAYR